MLCIPNFTWLHPPFWFWIWFRPSWQCESTGAALMIQATKYFVQLAVGVRLYSLKRCIVFWKEALCVLKGGSLCWRHGSAHDEPQYCQKGVLMSGSVWVEYTKTFTAYLDAIYILWFPPFPQKTLAQHIYCSIVKDNYSRNARLQVSWVFGHAVSVGGRLLLNTSCMTQIDVLRP